MARLNFVFLVLAAFAISCSSPSVIAFQPAGSRCAFRLTATPSHPFLAEFGRNLEVACDGSSHSFELEADSGGYGRIELAQARDGSWVVSDAFETLRLHSNSGDVLDRRRRVGEAVSPQLMRACPTSALLAPGSGRYLGAFDWCQGEWVFIPSQGAV